METSSGMPFSDCLKELLTSGDWKGKDQDRGDKEKEGGCETFEDYSEQLSDLIDESFFDDEGVIPSQDYH